MLPNPQFDNASILITGGSGSLGKAVVAKLLHESNATRIIVFSRDELKQSQLREEFENNSRLRWFIGDVRDQNRLRRALHGVDFVIHAAALKQVDTGEYNPIEFIKTNVLGSQNVIEASIDAGVKKVLALSTDKASSPINLYGATKLTADKLFIAANNYGHSQGTSFSVVRYGNVMGSRGSVIPFFLKLASGGHSIPITDYRMTRFLISLEDAADFVLDSFILMNGGELYVPRIPSIRIVDLAAAIAPKAKTYEIGIRPGEKLHEEMISADDSRRTILLEGQSRFVVLPVAAQWGFEVPPGQFVLDGEAYSSNNNKVWMTEKDLISYVEKLSI